METKIETVAYHRNGIAAAGFYVVLFTDDSPKVAILFDADHHCAVLDREKLARGDIAFRSNSWRGDLYESDLRMAVLTYSQRETSSDQPPAVRGVTRVCMKLFPWTAGQVLPESLISALRRTSTMGRCNTQ
jgi:hypothetical protein